jgi:hypothetical protein
MKTVPKETINRSIRRTQVNFSTPIRDIINPVHNHGEELLIWAGTTLISGLVIIVSISPAYLSELNPFTLLLLSIACSLPFWALNQLLWSQISKSITAELVQKIVFIADVSNDHQKQLSFALGQIFRLADVIRFVPYQKIGNLVTVFSIYLGSGIYYFLNSSPAVLFLLALAISIVLWLIGLYSLHAICRKIDAKPLRALWQKLKEHDEFAQEIHRQFKRMEEILRTMKQPNQGPAKAHQDDNVVS